MPKTERALPEGMEVAIIPRGYCLTSELKAEIVAWRAAGDATWAMIDEWERDDGISSCGNFDKEIQAGLDDLDAGNRVEASEVYAEARTRIQAREGLSRKSP